MKRQDAAGTAFARHPNFPCTLAIAVVLARCAVSPVIATDDLADGLQALEQKMESKAAAEKAAKEKAAGDDVSCVRRRCHIGEDDCQREGGHVFGNHGGCRGGAVSDPNQR